MPTSIRHILIAEIFTASTAATVNGTPVDAALETEFAAALTATEDVNGSTLDVKLQDSPDGGTTWFDWIAFTQLSATGSEVKAATRPPLGLVRSVRTLSAGGGTFTGKLFLSSNPLR